MNNKSKDIRILSVSSNTGYQCIGTLVRTRLGVLGKSLPGEGIDSNTPNQPILGIAITPSADVLITDTEYGDSLTVTSGTNREFWIDNAIDKLMIKNNATVAIELFLGKIGD